MWCTIPIHAFIWANPNISSPVTVSSSQRQGLIVREWTCWTSSLGNQVVKVLQTYLVALRKPQHLNLCSPPVKLEIVPTAQCSCKNEKIIMLWSPLHIAVVVATLKYISDTITMWFKATMTNWWPWKIFHCASHFLLRQDLWCIVSCWNWLYRGKWTGLWKLWRQGYMTNYWLIIGWFLHLIMGAGYITLFLIVWYMQVGSVTCDAIATLCGVVSNYPCSISTSIYACATELPLFLSKSALG